MSETWAVIDDETGDVFCNYTGLDGVEDSNDASVPTEPQENGQCYAYNKVPMPVDVSVRILFSGDYANQQTALSRIESFRTGTKLFTIVTPARVYRNMALVGYSSTRTATNGANLLEVDCRFQEITNATVGTQTVTWQPKNPTSAEKVRTGQASVMSDVLGGYVPVPGGKK